jgi:thiosulfate reductase cytochrome b subunit
VCYRPDYMAELVQVGAISIEQHGHRKPRHTALVRMTHWINTAAFLALVISGVAILMAHPRLYWGETGAFGSAALIELPLPLNLEQSGWGRSLHFLAAWLCVLNGVVYIVSGVISNHFVMDMMPEFRWTKPSDQDSPTYNLLQRLTYLTVVFVLFPLMLVTGLSMSPAVMAAVPFLVELFGGYQSCRTVHFIITNALVLFLIIHITMVYLAGFGERTRAMITGHYE